MNSLNKMRGWPACLCAALVAIVPFTSSHAFAAQSGCETASAFFGRLSQTSPNTYMFRNKKFSEQLKITFEFYGDLHNAIVCKAGGCTKLPFNKVFIPEPDQVITDVNDPFIYYQIYLVSELGSNVIYFTQRYETFLIEDLNWDKSSLTCK